MKPSSFGRWVWPGVDEIPSLGPWCVCNYLFSITCSYSTGKEFNIRGTPSVCVARGRRRPSALVCVARGGWNPTALMSVASAQMKSTQPWCGGRRSSPATLLPRYYSERVRDTGRQVATGRGYGRAPAYDGTVSI